MSDVRSIFNKLGICNSQQIVAKMILKKPKDFILIAKVKDFKYDEEDTKVIFERCEQTEKFPNDTATENPVEYMIYIKHIKSVERFD